MSAKKTKVNSYQQSNSRFFTKNNLGIGLVLLIVLVLFWLAHQPRFFPISSVTISGDYWKVSQATIRNTVNPVIQNSSYFFVDLKKIQQQLLTLPWVKSVNIGKQWPDTLNLTIEQKTAVASWNDVALIESNGDIFYPLRPSFPKDIPVLAGAKKDKMQLLLRLNQFNHYLLHAQNSANKHNAHQELPNLTITALKISPAANYSVEFNHKTVVMLGDINILAKFKRFVAIYKQVFEKQHKIPEYIDMRYSHGLAVKWQDQG